MSRRVPGNLGAVVDVEGVVRARPVIFLALVGLAGCVGARPAVEVVEVAAPVVAVELPASPRAPPPLPTSGAIGTAHPIAVQASAADGRWVVACQARGDTNGDGDIRVAIGPHGDFYGDAMVPYLIVGDGEGEAIEAYVASDSAGRRIVTLEGGALMLRDVSGGTRRVLDSGGFKRDARGAGGDMIAGFDRDRSLVYLRGADPMARKLVVHALADGRETVIDPGPGKLLRAFVPADGRYVVVAVDLPVGGKILGRVGYNSLHRGPCRGPVTMSSSFGGGGPPGEVRVIDLESDRRWSLHRGEGRLVGVLGEQAIVRKSDGSIWGAALDGSAPRLLVHASCRGVILAASAARGSLLIRCESIERPRLQIHDGERVRLLEHSTFSGGGDEWWGGDRPRPLVHLGSRSVLRIDLETERMTRIELPAAEGSRLLEWDAHHLLQRSGGSLQVIDLEEGVVRRLDARVGEYPRRVALGSIVAVDRVIVDLAAGELLGVVPALPAALTAAGHALTPEPLEHGVRVGGAVAEGPLWWRWPIACTGTCPEGQV